MNQEHWISLGKARPEELDVFPHWGIVTKENKRMMTRVETAVTDEIREIIARKIIHTPGETISDEMHHYRVVSAVKILEGLASECRAELWEIEHGRESTE